jgi:hypothetical protein
MKTDKFHTSGRFLIRETTRDSIDNGQTSVLIQVKAKINLYVDCSTRIQFSKHGSLKYPTVTNNLASMHQQKPSIFNL